MICNVQFRQSQDLLRHRQWGQLQSYHGHWCRCHEAKACACTVAVVTCLYPGHPPIKYLYLPLNLHLTKPVSMHSLRITIKRKSVKLCIEFEIIDLQGLKADLTKKASFDIIKFPNIRCQGPCKPIIYIWQFCKLLQFLYLKIYVII